MGINYRKNELEERMLMNLNKKAWTHGLELDDDSALAERNQLLNWLICTTSRFRKKY